MLIPLLHFYWELFRIHDWRNNFGCSFYKFKSAWIICFDYGEKNNMCKRHHNLSRSSRMVIMLQVPNTTVAPNQFWLRSIVTMKNSVLVFLWYVIIFVSSSKSLARERVAETSGDGSSLVPDQLSLVEPVDRLRQCRGDEYIFTLKFSEKLSIAFKPLDTHSYI